MCSFLNISVGRSCGPDNSAGDFVQNNGVQPLADCSGLQQLLGRAVHAYWRQGSSDRG